MICDCGNQHAYAIRKIAGIERQFCNECAGVSPSGISDVFWDGKANPNLTDNMGRPMEFLSRGHKARWMKEKGIEERGDLVKGSRWNPWDGAPSKPTPTEAKQQVREAVDKAITQVNHKYRT